MSAFHYYQQVGGEEHWEPIPVSQRSKIEAEKKPAFITVLSVSKLAEDLTYEDKLKLAYAGPAYFDWDSPDAELTIEKVNQFLDKLDEMGLDLDTCRLYATGKKGFHLEIPQESFMEKVPAKGYIGLPNVYREMALELCVDTLDLKIYSTGRGRMWRTPNVKRENGRYKVPITVAEMREMTPELYAVLTSEPRPNIEPTPAQFCVKLSVLFSKCAQKVEELLKRRAKFKPDPNVKEKAGAPSIQYMMAGLGLKSSAGFQEIATQLAIAAVNAGLTEDQFVAECAGLISSHQSDGSRYNTEAKRREELRRMHRYMDGNACYEFSIGAIKSLLDHPAPDLDGIAATKEEIKEGIDEAAAEAAEGDGEVDEYGDVAKGVTLSRFGVYMDTELGKKRICAISFANSSILCSAENSQIVGYETDVLVNGVRRARTKLELDVFAGLMNFSRFASRYGHAFQGSDAQVRTVMMRFVEQAKKKGKVQYVVTREGLDMVSVPLHENPLFHNPFLIWADQNGVVMPPHLASEGLELVFAGYPDPRGVYRTDISQAPQLVEWLEQDGNREVLKETLEALFTCQRPEALGKLLGWYTACFYKQVFYAVYKKFPLLHVNGPAGLGKTELNLGISSMYYWQGSARPLSPGSTNFAITQHLTASSSIPLIIDEYKPHEMKKEVHDRMKGMFRDAYNQRDVARGGGNRESDDYRQLQFTQLAAPLVFIAEASEDEAAVMERVVLVTLARPAQTIGLRNYARFQVFQRNQHLLGMLGQYLAADIVTTLDAAKFTEEFDALYAAARRRYMLNEEDLKGGLTEEELHAKQNAKERSVFNHTVARFGFQQFRRLVSAAVGNSLDSLMDEMEEGIYSRMSDLHAATTPEYVKVLKELASMSYSVEAARPDSIRHTYEYGFGKMGGRDTVELAVRTAYMRYRTYARSCGMNALFSSPEAFAHALKDSPAFIKAGTGSVLQMPGVYVFDANELARLDVPLFKK